MQYGHSSSVEKKKKGQKCLPQTVNQAEVQKSLQVKTWPP